MKQSVLLVDDDRNVLDALKRLFHKEPYTIYAVNSARAAIDFLQGISIDVIVADEQMPGMSGTELLQKVHQKFPEIVTIMLTGNANLEVALQAINQGEIYKFFTKPCNEIELAIAIREALKKTEASKRSDQDHDSSRSYGNLNKTEKRINFYKTEKRF